MPDHRLGEIPPDLREKLLDLQDKQDRHRVFHTYWTRAVREDGYYKPDWLDLENQLRQEHIL